MVMINKGGKYFSTTFDEDVSARIQSLESKVVTTNSLMNDIKERGIRATPKNILKPQILNSDVIPISVGEDGLFYGLRGNYSKQIHRSGDSYETFTSGYDFNPVIASSETPVFVTKTLAGYVVVVSDSTNNTARVFFSTEFGTGFTEVLAMPNGQISSWNIANPVHEYGQGVMILGEYAQNTIQKDIYITWDGGQTWELLRQTDVVDTTSGERSHWHTGIFDPVRERIWISQGDMANGKTEYSDDFGATWTEYDYANLSTPLQPTLIADLPNKVVFCPDRSSYATGVWQSNKDYSFIAPDEEITGDAYHSHTVFNVDSAKQYGANPIARNGNEMYITFAPRGSSLKKTFVTATGDGGNSWHNVYTFNFGTGASNWGIVGEDKNGKIVMGVNDNGTRQILVFNPIEWIYS